MTKKEDKKSAKDKDVLNEEKITSLQEMIANAERTITSAKQMLAKLEGGKPAISKPSSLSALPEDQNGQKVIYGNFDGQIMIGEDGKQYPVPANYASKSKLVEGDMLKLTVTGDGNFIYKQVGPIERKYLMGIVRVDEKGNHFVDAEGKKYRVLLAAATYFKIEAGDEVTIVVPRDKSCVWGAIENVLRKAEDISDEELENYNKPQKEDFLIADEEIKIEDNEDEDDEEDEDEEERPSAIEKLKQEMEEERKKSNSRDIFDEWTPDIEELKKEASYPAKAAKE